LGEGHDGGRLRIDPEFRWEKVLEHATLAYELDPLSANTIGETARHYLTAGRPKEALDLAENALSLDAHNLVARSIRAYATEMLGNPREALRQMLETYEMTGEHPLMLMGIGYVYARMNEKGKAQEIISKIEAIQQQTPESHLDYVLAVLYANIGDMEKFHLAYNRAIERKAEWIVKFYGAESFRPVWYDEEVIASRRKLGLPVYSRSHSAPMHL